MPEIAAAQTAADMTYAKPHAFLPTGGSNRRAARVQAAALRWLVRMAALLTAAVLVFLIGYILVMGIPNLKPELFAWEYNSENVSLTPALINTVLMTAFSLAISTPLGIFAAIWLVEYAHRGSKLVRSCASPPRRCRASRPSSTACSVCCSSLPSCTGAIR